MIATNPAWDAKNAALAKMPIYVFTIGRESVVYSTHDLVRAGITGALPEFQPWLKVPRGASQTIDVVNGQSSIGELECEVVDVGGAVRRLVGTTPLEGASATLSVGYPGIAYDEFVVLHAYQIYKVTPARGYGAYLFKSRDKQMKLKRTIRLHPENGAPLSEENPWILCGTPGEIIQAVYLFALGREEADIDRAGLAALDAAAEGMHIAARPYRFVITEATEAKQFLEQEIFQTAGMYPVVLHTGQISARAPRPPATGAAGAFTFDADNICVLPDVDRVDIVNEIIFQIDAEGSDYATQLVIVDGGSISTYGRARQLRIESKGLRTELGAWWFCQETARRIFRRFAGVSELRGGATIASVEAFLLTLPVWVGDFVFVTHPQMPDLTTGALGVVERLYEVIDRAPDYARGRMKYKLLDTGLTGKAGAVGWGEFLIGTSEVY